MTLLDHDFRWRCECLYRAARRIWGDRLLGRRVEKRPAGGTEVTGFHDYTSGDDYRYVDWYRCARHDELLTKEFRGNDDHHTYLLLDCSASMGVGGGAKFPAARRLAAALGYLALANLDRVGAAAFADRIVAEQPAIRGRRRIPEWLSFIDGLCVEQAATSLTRAAEAFASGPQRRGLVVVISDLLDPSGFQSPLDLLRRRGFQLHVVHLYDRSEAEPDLAGGVRLEDVETGRTLRATIDEQDRRNYRDVFEEFRLSVRQYCFRYSIGLTQVTADVGFEQCIQQMMRASQFHTL